MHESGRRTPKSYKFNVKYAQDTKKGRLTISTFLGDKQMEASFVAKPIRNKDNKISSWEYNLVSVKQIDTATKAVDREYAGARLNNGFNEMRNELLTATPETMPYYNIDKEKVAKSQDPNSGSFNPYDVVEHGDHAEGTHVDYIRDILLTRTSTNIDAPLLLPSGYYTYVTNSIVTLGFNDNQATERAKRAASQKKDAKPRAEKAENKEAKKKAILKKIKSFKTIAQLQKMKLTVSNIQTKLGEGFSTIASKFDPKGEGLDVVIKNINSIDVSKNLSALNEQLDTLDDELMKSKDDEFDFGFDDVPDLSDFEIPSDTVEEVSETAPDQAPEEVPYDEDEDKVSATDQESQEFTESEFDLLNQIDVKTPVGEIIAHLLSVGEITYSEGGIQYLGKTYKTTDDLTEVVSVDASPLLKGDGTFKKGKKAEDIVSELSTPREEKAMSEVESLEAEIDALKERLTDPDTTDMQDAFVRAEIKGLKNKLAKAVQKAERVTRKKSPSMKYERVKPNVFATEIPLSEDLRRGREAIRQYREKVVKKGTTLRLNASEEEQLTQSMKTYYLQGFVGQLGSTPSDDVATDSVRRGTHRYAARMLATSNYKALSKELSLLQETFDKDSNDYKKTVQLKTQVENLLANTDYFEKILLRAEDYALSQLGFIVTVEEDVADVTGSMKGLQQEAWQNKNFSIMKDPKEGMTSRMRAKLSILNKWTVDQSGDIKPDLNLFGTEVLDENAYVKLMYILSNGVHYSYQEKIDTLTELANEIEANPEMNVNQMFVLDLLDDIENNYTHAEKQQFSAIMDKDVLNMRGMDYNKESDGSYKTYKRLFEKNFNFASLFRNTMSTIKINMDNLRETESIFMLNNVISGATIPEGIAIESESVVDTRKSVEKALSLGTTGMESMFAGASIGELANFLEDLHRNIDSIINTPMKGSSAYKRAFKNPLYTMQGKEGEQVPVLSSDGQQFVSKARSVIAVAARHTATKVTNTLNVASVPISGNTSGVLTAAFTDNTLANDVSFFGDELSTKSPLISFVGPFVRDMVRLTEKGNRQPGMGIKNLTNWVLNKSGGEEGASSIQVGSKKLSALNDPTALMQEMKRIHHPDFRDKLERDIFASKSRILQAVIKNPALGDRLEWISKVFKNPSRAGLLSTWESDVDKADNPYIQDLFRVGSYLQRISFGYKDKYRKYPGERFEPFVDTIGGVEYGMEVREGVFQSATKSDSGHIFNITGFDFNAVEDVKGSNVKYGDQYINYFIDSIVVPELNRYLQTDGNDVRTKGYNGELIYGVPSLNENLQVQRLLDNLELGGEELLSLFSPRLDKLNKKSTNDTVNLEKNLSDLRNMVKEATKELLFDSINNQIEKSVEVGLLIKDGTDYFLSKELSSIEEFRRLGAPYGAEDLSAVSQEKKIDRGEEFIEMANKALTERGGWKSAQETAKAFDLLFTPDTLEQILLKAKSFDLKDPDTAATKILAYMGLKNLTLDDLQELKSYKPQEVEADPDDFFDNDDTETISETEAIKAYDIASKGLSGGDRIIPGIQEQLGRVKLETDGDLVKVNNDTLRRVFGNKAMGDSFGLANMYQLVYGDIANEYKSGKQTGKAKYGQAGYDYNSDISATKSNNGKRLKRLVSPVVASEGSMKTSYILFDEPTRTSTYYNNSDKYGNLADIGSPEIADAQSFVTVNSWIAFRVAEGSLVPEAIGATKRFLEGIITGEEFEAETSIPSIKITDLVMKPRGVGFQEEAILDARGNPTGKFMRKAVYVKTAEVVLTKVAYGDTSTNEMVRRKLFLEKLEGEKNKGLDITKDYTRWHGVRGASPTAMKTGLPKGLLNPNMPIETDLSDFTVELSMGDWGRQQRTDSKDDKKVYNSGQMENVLFSGIEPDFEAKIVNEPGNKRNVRKAWDDLHLEAHIVARNNLAVLLANIPESDTYKLLQEDDMVALKRIMLNVKKNPKLREKTSDQTIANIIKSSLRQQGKELIKTNPQLVKWLETDMNGNFKYDITIAPDFQTYIDRVRTSFESKTVKRKKRGSQLALVTDLGVDLNDKSQGWIKVPGAEIETDGRLRPQLPSINGEPGKPAQIIAPFNIKYYDSEGRSHTLKMSEAVIPGTNRLDPNVVTADILAQIGYRTPTQGYSMVSDIEIVAFAPESYGNSVIAPMEFVALMGSDFDIDKLFSYRYGLIKTDSGRLEILNDSHVKGNMMLKQVELENRRMNILRTILQDDKIIRNNIIQALNEEEKFKDIADKLERIKGDQKDFTKASILDSTYHETKSTQADQASMGISVAAKGARIFAQVRYADLELFTQVKDKESGEKVAIPTTVQVGDKSITHFAQEGDNLFKRHDKLLFSERTMNNNNMNISIAVDNETLQLFHRLNFGNHTYDQIQSLLLTGFSLENITSIIGLPFYNIGNLDADRVKLLDSLYVLANKGEESGFTRTGKKQVTSKDLSFMKGERKFESEMVAHVDRLNESWRKGELPSKDAVDLIALYNMVQEVAQAYRNTVRPFTKEFNRDSKGFEREIGELMRNADKTRTPKLAAIWDKLGDVTEIKYSSAEQVKFADTTNQLFRGSGDVLTVNSKLSESGIRMTGLSDISKEIRAWKYRRKRVEFKALHDRLIRLRSAGGEIATFVNGNTFLSSVLPKKTEITFVKRAGILVRDVINDLEALKHAGIVAGIDMKILHEDLINYGITTKTWGFGNNYSFAILPEYLQGALESETVPVNKISARIAFKNESKVTSNPTKPIYKKKTNDGLEIVYLDVENNIRTYTEDDYTQDNFDPRTEVQKAVQFATPEEQEGSYNPNVINMEDTMERLFTSRRNAGVKELLKVVFRNQKVTAIKSEISNSWYNKTRTMRLKFDLQHSKDKRATTAARLRGNIVHESMHVALDRFTHSYLQGTLGEDYPGITEQEKAVALELARVFKSLDTQRIALTDSIGEALIEDMLDQLNINVDERFANDKISWKAGVNAILTNNFLTEFNNGADLLTLLTDSDVDNIFSTKTGTDEARRNIIKQEFRNITNGNDTKTLTTKEYRMLVHRAMEIGMRDHLFQVVPRQAARREFEAAHPTAPRSRDTILSFIKKDNNTRVYGYGIDAQTYQDYKGILSRLNTTADEKIDIYNEVADYALDRENKREKDWYQKLIYGTQNLHEFMSETYSKGTGYNNEFLTYSNLKDYKGAHRSIPEKIAAIFNKAFNLVREMIETLLGKDATNDLFKDVAYAASLTEVNTFVDNNLGTKPTVTHSNLAKEILKTC
jgi:hypothetical protein